MTSAGCRREMCNALTRRIGWRRVRYFWEPHDFGHGQIWAPQRGTRNFSHVSSISSSSFFILRISLASPLLVLVPSTNSILLGTVHVFAAGKDAIPPRCFMTPRCKKKVSNYPPSLSLSLYGRPSRYPNECKNGQKLATDKNPAERRVFFCTKAAGSRRFNDEEAKTMWEQPAK